MVGAATGVPMAEVARPSEEFFYLSQLLSRRVVSRDGERVGRLIDLGCAANEAFPRVLTYYLRPGLLAPVIGNTYSAAVPLGLAATLDVAKPGDRVFVTAYGSGAGSDSFDITVTDGIQSLERAGTPTVQSLVERKVMIDYATYAKIRGKLRLGGGNE